MDETKIKNMLTGIKSIFPIFRATLPPDITLLGFPFAKEEAIGIGEALGKYFLIEEQPTEPRFGLDAPAAKPPELSTWDDLSWSHFGFGTNEENQRFGIYLDAVPNPEPLSPKDNNDGKSWEKATSATRAWITLQQPVRIDVHARQMIPTN